EVHRDVPWLGLRCGTDGADQAVETAELLQDDGAHDCTPSMKDSQGTRKSRMAAAISAAWVSSAKWPVSRKRTTASGMSRLKASAPAARQQGSLRAQVPRHGA